MSLDTLRMLIMLATSGASNSWSVGELKNINNNYYYNMPYHSNTIKTEGFEHIFSTKFSLS